VPLGITGEAVPPLTGPGLGVAQPYAPPAQQQAFPQQGYAPQGFPPPPAQPYAAPFHGYVPPPAYGAPPQPVAPPRPRHAVPRQRLVDAGMIVPDGGPTAQLEEFRIVKRQLLGQVEELRRMGSGAASQRIMISSPHPAEGKTFCAVNLAMSIAAEKEAEVVLVDLDLARSSALDILGIKNGPGLMDALVDPRIDVRRLVIPTDIHGLSVLPGGRPTNSDAEYLASSRAPRVLDMLTEGRRAASSSSIRRRPLPPCSPPRSPSWSGRWRWWCWPTRRRTMRCRMPPRCWRAVPTSSCCSMPSSSARAVAASAPIMAIGGERHVYRGPWAIVVCGLHRGADHAGRGHGRRRGQATGRDAGL
jgi:hypothetical protein